MKKPVTITLDNKMERQLRKLQAVLIKQSYSNVSFSGTITLVLEKGLKHFKFDY